MNDIMAFIADHYPDPLTLDQLSRQINISPFYLSRSFKQFTGFSFLDYVHTVRIRKSQRLLRETNRKVAMIGEQVRFLSHSHFSRVFKKVTSVSPLD